MEQPAGLLLVDKPAGISSFDVIRRLRPILGIRKLGHAGTLDPLASGLMLILVGRATKRAAELSKLDKTYRFTLRLGQDSATGDAEGPIAQISDRLPTLAEIEAVLPRFTGQITQVPSAHSAIKIGGVRAYKLARKGQAVTVPPRTIIVHSLNLLRYQYPELELEACVSSGTYIRTLSQDIGRTLGTGAYVSQLRRTSVGGFNLNQALDLDSINQIPELLALPDSG